VGERERGRFATTHWSLVIAAGGPQTSESSAALEALCQIYWYPLYAFVRRAGYGVEQAQDSVQAFFVHLLEHDSLGSARQDRGRFRSFLLGALKHFLANEYDRGRALKRGGGQPLLTLDVSSAESRYAFEPRDESTPETLFERRWAMTLIDRVHMQLRTALVRSGKGALFEQLKDYITGVENDVSYRDVGSAAGLSEGAVRVTVHRLRRRFREVLRDEIRQTVSDPAEIDSELDFLLGVLSRTGARAGTSPLDDGGGHGRVHDW
jgi:DNA-directed RNA polymerase specialized sigma24 family protein